MQTTTHTISTEEFDTIAQINENLKFVMAQNQAILSKMEEMKITNPNPKPEPLPEPEQPEPTEFKNIQSAYDNFMKSDETHFVIDGKCEVPFINKHSISSTKIIKGVNNAILKFGVENYNKWKGKQSGVLIELKNNARVLFKDVNLCQPKQLTNVIEPWRPNIFLSNADIHAEWVAVVDNCDTTILGEHGGLGLGYFYGSRPGNIMMARNMKHVGDTFCDAKVAVGGDPESSLNLILHKVTTDSEDDQKFGTHAIKVEGVIKDNVFTIVSDDTFDQFRNIYFVKDNRYAIGNYAFVLHIGRYTFMLDSDKQIDNKSIGLRPLAHGKMKIVVKDKKVYVQNGYEGHVSDTFILNGITHTIIEKNRDEFDLWINSYKGTDTPYVHNPYLLPDKTIVDGTYEVEWVSSFDSEGIEQRAYLLYKESSYSFKSTAKTKFEDFSIMQGGVIGHNMYNHQNITLDARHTVQKGYYRQTPRGGKCLGYNMVNCKGFKDEFNPPVKVTSIELPLPDKVLELIKE